MEQKEEQVNMVVEMVLKDGTRLKQEILWMEKMQHHLDQEEGVDLYLIKIIIILVLFMEKVEMGEMG